MCRLVLCRLAYRQAVEAGTCSLQAGTRSVQASGQAV
jgi:hypothetical protein